MTISKRRVCAGRDPSRCFRGAVGGPQGFRTVSPPPGPGDSPVVLPLLPHFTRARGTLRHCPRSPASPGPRPRSSLRPRSLRAGPGRTCLSPAEKGCLGTPRSLSPAACPQHSRPPGPAFLLSHRPVHGRTGQTGQGLAEMPSRTSSVPRVPPWDAGLQSAAARHPVSAGGPARTSLGGTLAAVDSHICLTLELCDCLPPQPDLPMALSSRAEASFKPPSSLHGPRFLAGSRQSPTERPLLQSLSLPRAEIHPSAH